MTNVIRIDPIPNHFSITWNLGRRCNYDCMYCGADVHDNTSSHKDLNTLQANWTDIYQKTQGRGRYKISFTGGEVTANKHFLPFVEWLRGNYIDIDQILATTNGSATYEYYLRMFQVVDNISFSTHSEHIDEVRFFDTMIQLKQNLPSGRHMHVNIMDEYWNSQRIPQYVDILNSHGISNMVNSIDYSKQIRTIPILKGKLNLAI